MFYCSKCGVLDEKGTLLTHRCSVNRIPNSVPNIPNKWPTEPAQSTKRKVIERKPETTGDFRTLQQTNAKSVPVMSASQRSTNWKKKNPEKYREYMRELMRKRRESNS